MEVIPTRSSDFLADGTGSLLIIYRISQAWTLYIQPIKSLNTPLVCTAVISLYISIYIIYVCKSTCGVCGVLKSITTHAAALISQWTIIHASFEWGPWAMHFVHVAMNYAFSLYPLVYEHCMLCSSFRPWTLHVLFIVLSMNNACSVHYFVREHCIFPNMPALVLSSVLIPWGARLPAPFWDRDPPPRLPSQSRTEYFTSLYR